MRIEPLTREHDFSHFDCGDPSLNTYLKSFALQARSRGLGRTFVAVEEGSNVVLGYYTRLPNSVVGDLIPESKSRNSVPVMLFGRLAVVRERQRDGIGKLLLRHFFEAAIAFAEEEACFAITLDALNQEAKNWYLQWGFKECLDDPFHLYLPMKTVRKAKLI